MDGLKGNVFASTEDRAGLILLLLDVRDGKMQPAEAAEKIVALAAAPAAPK